MHFQDVMNNIWTCHCFHDHFPHWHCRICGYFIVLATVFYISHLFIYLFISFLRIKTRNQVFCFSLQHLKTSHFPPVRRYCHHILHKQMKMAFDWKGSDIHWLEIQCPFCHIFSQGSLHCQLWVCLCALKQASVSVQWRSLTLVLADSSTQGRFWAGVGNPRLWRLMYLYSLSLSTSPAPSDKWKWMKYLFSFISLETSLCYQLAYVICSPHRNMVQKCVDIQMCNMHILTCFRAKRFGGI